MTIALARIELATPEQVRRAEAGIHSMLKRVFEAAGMRKETPVMHHGHTEAMSMDIRVEMESGYGSWKLRCRMTNRKMSIIRRCYFS